MHRDVCRRALVIRALKDLEQSGVPARAEVIASIALHLNETSKMRFEVKYLPTRGLCLAARSLTLICRCFGMMRPNATAPLGAIWIASLQRASFQGTSRTHIHLTTFPMHTCGFSDARGKRAVAVVIDLIKCLQRGVRLFVAGGETLLTSGVPFSSSVGLQISNGRRSPGLHFGCV